MFESCRRRRLACTPATATRMWKLLNLRNRHLFVTWLNVNPMRYSRQRGLRGGGGKTKRTTNTNKWQNVHAAAMSLAASGVRRRSRTPRLLWSAALKWWKTIICKQNGWQTRTRRCDVAGVSVARYGSKTPGVPSNVARDISK